MKERPILFSAPMVRAILDGRKSQTRRVAKEFDGRDNLDAILRRFPNQKGCPYGEPGDRLWVRETWAQPAPLDPGPTVYRADYPGCVPAGFENIPPADAIRWKPSIHMPRALSRITLEITGVRVERLQDISVADALAEGVRVTYGEPFDAEHTIADRRRFELVWKEINGAGSWESNPWVWVIEFARITTEDGK
ncbi:hypothetical protein [Burkholderia gladioli]|uniref:hypothetical protein n=1 Tax=Burkholderia gladioli TaxID=28095 RepID=UPI001640AF91|nr:hypothetical protein [Burkholderia gladioli]